MTDRLTLARRLGAPALAVTLALGGCSQTFVDEETSKPVDDGNVAKSLLMSMGAIEDENPKSTPKFQPRAPLVVPPKRNLPTPVDSDAQLSNKRFPVDPEVAAQREREAIASSSAPDDGRRLTYADQQKYKDLPMARTPGRTAGKEQDAQAPLKPWELDGKAQKEAVAALENTPQKRREQALIAPPIDYRTPSSKAPVESQPETGQWKPGWWPF